MQLTAILQSISRAESHLTQKLKRVMRLTAILLLTVCLHVAAKTNGQTVTLNVKDAPMKKVFREIQKQTGLSVIMEESVLEKLKSVTLDVHDMPVSDVLAICLKDEALSYSIIDRRIVVKSITTPDLSRGVISLPPPIDIHGRVTDSLGNPLVGASVFVKGSRKGAITDAKGEFVLKGVSDDNILVISFTGYVSKEYKANNNSFNIALSRSNNPLDQVQIIAYGTTTQRLSTGDVSTVAAKEIEQQPVTNPLAALEGRVPGLVVTQTTGAPGGGFAVQIRGQSSILNGNDPFYVIDGVPYPSETLGLINGVLRNGSPLNFINSADIERIDILKDADATSIYGSRAANGAILITTKKGTAGKMKVDINVYSGIGQVTRQVKPMDTHQYLQMRNEAFYNDSIANPAADIHPTISNAPDLVFWDTTRYTNWQKVLLGNQASYTDAQANVSGGAANTQYLIGAGYHRETNVFPVALPGQGVNQIASLHFNLTNYSENKKLKLILNGAYSANLNTIQTNDYTYNGYQLPPDAPPIYNPDGTLNWAPVTPGQAGTWTNPYASLYQQYKGQTSNLISNFLLSYSILSNLEFKTSLGYTNTQTNEVVTYPTTSVDPGYNLASGLSQFNATNTHSWIFEPQINYHTNLSKGLFSALAGLTFQENNTSVQNLIARGFVNDALLQDIQAASSVTATGTGSQYKYNALFGRLNYNWQGKYIVNLSGRRDGSSRFGPGNQFANFGSVGAAWIFSEENLFKYNLPFISFGKIRFSYGTSGNDQIGDYRFLDLYTSTSVPYQGIQGLYPNNLFNPNLAWELDKKIEGGLELGLFKDRIYINANYFRNRSGNQLVTEPVSFVTGFASTPANLPALVQNSGGEFTLNSANIKTKTFSWRTMFNLTIPRNKLVSFPGLANSPYSSSYIVGQPITIQKVFHMVGVNDTTGLYEYALEKGGLTYSPAYNVDNTAIVNASPKYYGGILNSFQWKSFSLDILFQFVKQTGQNIFYSIYTQPGMMQNQPAIVFNRWQKPGDVKPYQIYSQSYGQAFTSFTAMAYSDYAYSDASFIRLKNLSISYSVPARWNQKWHLQNLRVYLLAQNLLTITKYIGADPESQGNNLPPLRVLTAGFQLTL